MPLDIACGLSRSQNIFVLRIYKTYLTTLTDHPKFGGSELSMSSNVDRVAAVKVFESMKIKNGYISLLEATFLHTCKP